MPHYCLRLAATLVFQLLSLSAMAQSPRIAVSILPLQLLVKVITGPENPPRLILPAGQSPHDHLLRPSEMLALRSSTLVFWIGPQLEGFLVRPLAALPASTRVVSLLQALVQSPEPESEDPHLWLDPALTAAMVKQITAALSKADPAHASIYQARSNALQGKLLQLDKKLTKIFQSVRNIPFIVYHDGFQRLAKHYGLNLVARVSRNPGQPISLRRLQKIRRIVAERKVSCLFSEPQFPNKRLQPLLQEGMRSGVLDPLGILLPPDQQSYEQLLRQLAINLSDCLTASAHSKSSPVERKNGLPEASGNPF